MYNTIRQLSNSINLRIREQQRLELHDEQLDRASVEYLQKELGMVRGLSDLFAVLGDETRTKIVFLLSLRPLCTHDIATILGVTLPTVSHHLRMMRLMRLVKHTRKGKRVIYELDDSHVMDLISIAREHFREPRETT